MTKKPVTYWAIKHPRGFLIYDDICVTRKWAIIRMMEYFPNKTWRQLRQLGYTAVKVRITEVKKRKKK